MLNFTGIGSAFNTAFGNTSAYFICGDQLVMFDCGENTFTRIQNTNFFDGIKKIHVFITHDHPDHIGSLGTLIFYCKYILKIDIHVYGDLGLLSNLNSSGVSLSFFQFHNILLNMADRPVFEIRPVLGDVCYKISPIWVKHHPDLNCLGYHIKEEQSGKSCFFSGDSCEIPECILKAFLEGWITYLYQDTSWLDYKDSVHLSYKKLCQLIDNRRSNVYIMHLDQNFNINKAQADGFKIAGRE